MYIETRILGKKARPLDGWSVPNPPGFGDGDGENLTLRELITRVVLGEVNAFERREQTRRLLRVLSDSEISTAAAKGKIDAGGHAPGATIDRDSAVAAALQGFEDGLYLVILDGNEQRHLDSPVYLSPDSKLVFLRLTFLAGA